MKPDSTRRWPSHDTSLAFSRHVAGLPTTRRWLLHDTSLSSFRRVESIELPSVEDIMPNGVEASSNGGQGVEESVTHPNGKYGILLPTSLAGRDGFSVMLADKSPKPKLRDASHEGTRQNQQTELKRHLSMHENPRRDCNCERQRDQPKIEWQVGNRGEET